MSRLLYIYVDVDETLVRNYGTKRIPMPNVIAHVKKLHEQGQSCTAGVLEVLNMRVSLLKSWALRTVLKHFYPNLKCSLMMWSWLIGDC